MIPWKSKSNINLVQDDDVHKNSHQVPRSRYPGFKHKLLV